MKTLAWWLTGSVGLLSDAMESFVNLASALFALAMVTIAARPADDDHPFGHTKAEYFSSGFEGLLIAAAAVAIIWAALLRFMHLQPLEGARRRPRAHRRQLGAQRAAGVEDDGRVARSIARSRSKPTRAISMPTSGPRPASSSAWCSCNWTGWLWLDPVIAICVAANIIREGARVVWGSVDGLMDKAVEPEVQARIDRTLARFAESRSASTTW